MYFSEGIQISFILASVWILVCVRQIPVPFREYSSMYISKFKYSSAVVTMFLGLKVLKIVVENVVLDEFVAFLLDSVNLPIATFFAILLMVPLKIAYCEKNSIAVTENKNNESKVTFANGRS
jgi:hypothetical protein